MTDENQNELSTRWGILVWLLFIIIITTSVFSGYLSNDFIYDDEYLILTSDYYDRPFQAGDLALDLGKVLCGRDMGYWRPGQMILYRIQYELFGENPKGWNTTALLLHIAATCLFFFLINRLTQNPRIAGMAALLFALHPAVDEVIGSNNFQISSAEGIFTFAALLAWGGKREIVTAICMLAALSFRESALVLPMVFFLFLFLDSEGFSKKRILKLAWPVGMAAVYLIIRYGFLDITMLKAQETFGLFSRIGLIAFLAVRSIFFPVPSLLSIAHDPKPETLSVVLGWSFIAICLGLVLFLTARAIKGKDKPAAILFGSCLVLAAPYSGIIPPYVLFAEHYFYLPLAFLVATLATLLLNVKKTSVVSGLAFFLIAIFGAISYGRAGVFHDNGRAFGHALKLYPESIEAHMSLGTFFYRLGDHDRAIKEYMLVLNLTNGEHAKAWNNLGDIYFRNKRWHDAQKCFLQAGEEGERNLAIVLFVKKDYKRARPLVEKLVLEYPMDRTIREMSDFLKKIKEP